ncbi:MAG: hypothetical protein M3362_04185 [Acidobacteriota bacterium]|nr:hypothetical protein [Acidobacteriota bacterium]
MFDWQTIATGLVILAALIYAGRLAWLRLRAFRAGRGGARTCETGCGTCGGEKPKQAATERTVFVEISRSRPSSRPR